MKIVLSCLLLILAAQPAFAFPEMIRHGYTNCTSCHISPTGGGALTAYGRELSRELLSSWGREGEQKALYVYEPPETQAIGGDFRTLYLYRDNPAVREGKWLFMQADVEAYQLIEKKFWIGGAIGLEKPNPEVQQYRFISRRHFVNYRPTDQISVRGGRFMPAFGINVPDHAISTKRDLLWDQGSESYNVEVAWLGDVWNFFATAIFGRPDEKERKAEVGGALVASRAFLDKHRIGLNAFHGENEDRRRQVVGPSFLLGFTEHFFLLSEFDVQWSALKRQNRAQRGFVSHHRLGYELSRGWIAYGTYDLRYLDDQSASSRADTFGVGAQWFPRPHLELNGSWQKRRASPYNDQFVDVAYFLLHFYI